MRGLPGRDVSDPCRGEEDRDAQPGGRRATFAINVPLGIASLLLGLLFLPRATLLDAPSSGGKRIDLVGIALFAGTLVCLLPFLMNLRLATLWIFAPATTLAAGFAVWELRHAEPVIHVRVFAGSGWRTAAV